MINPEKGPKFEMVPSEKKPKKTKEEEKFEAPVEEREEKITPFIEVKKDKVNVMGVEIPKNPERGERTPNPEKFRNFIEDEFSLDILQRIAKGIALDQPTILEGEAAVGKSMSIEYLAHLANQEVYRMSLNGQTDTTDLIGKWVPRTEEWRKRVEDLYKHPEKCRSPEARKLIEATKIKPAKEEEIAPEKYEGKPKVSLNKEESMEIAELEGIPVAETDWVWQDGELPRQIENGAWTVLDEVNTCEPQILVRLNALLERGGQLVLHEDGDRIPKPKDPNKKHMLFATTNPPGERYRGRVPLSAEYLSRWNYQNIGELPQEVDIFREKMINGTKPEMTPEMLKRLRMKVVEAEPIEKEMTLADIFGDKWTNDFTEKYVTAYRKIKEMVQAGEIGETQEQAFDYDQRDKERFREYVRKFRERGGIKKTIEDAIEYCWLGKLKNPKDQDKARDIVLRLIKVSEPREQIPQDEKEQKKIIKNLKADIIGMGISEKHRDALFEKISP